jgi:polyisoprenoid-binding protein YceI
MKRILPVCSVLGSALAVTALFTGTITLAQSPLAINTARITIAGTSNVHDYSATTAQAKVTRVQLGDAAPGATFWDDVQKPGGLQAFELTVPAVTLKSSKDGLDKNMYKALKVSAHPEIGFSLKRMEGAPGALKAIGTLRIAGVEQDVTLPLKTSRKGENLAVSGELDLLMTDYGIAAPKAMMGMVKASPKIKVTFEVLLGVTST